MTRRTDRTARQERVLARSGTVLSEMTMTVKSPRSTGREAAAAALRGRPTDEKRRTLESRVSGRIKDAVRKSIARNKAALRELADY